MDKLTVHSIVAGSTGGGKSISAQVIIEECLMKDVAVIVFDPTAQWSGMLRKCQDEKMISYYPRFHMTKKDSRAFSGNVRAIKNEREKIELQKYWKPGEIQVFTTSTLAPAQMDIFVANTVRAVFKSNLQEFRGLRFMMVYDEVHRLLPKFGGSGEGFVQIERACREFRKWGIGVMLISQVLNDFMGQIKANINTEVQMKTRDEGDLNRIKDKYGAAFIQELVKSPVGSGMIQNSSWNRGLPYYVTFRPIIHSVVRLSDEELEQYNKYNSIADDLEYQLEQLETEGKDVFDLRLELKLSVDKIKQGGFNMVEIYLEGLKPRIEKIWTELGKTPKHLELELVSDAELKADIDQAKSDSEKAKAEEKANEVVGEEGPKSLGLNDEVSADKILNLCNGTLVNKLKALVDELKVLKDDEFKKHVAEGKNDFSDWIRNSILSNEWANIADKILTKEDFITFLTSIEEGKEKTFKPTTKREKPYSSKKEIPKEELKEPPAKPTTNVGNSKPVQNIQTKTAQAQTKVVSNTQPTTLNTPQTEVNNTSQDKTAQTQPVLKTQPKVQNIPQTKVNNNPQNNQQQQASPKNNAQVSQTQQPVQVKQNNESIIQNKLSSLKTSQERLQYLNTLLSKNPKDIFSLFMIAHEFHVTKNLDQAEIYYKKVLEISKEHPKALFNLGSVYTSKKDYNAALNYFRKVVELQPNYPNAKNYVTSIQKLIVK